MKKITLVWLLALAGSMAFAQKGNKEILKGNEAYKKQDYIKATDYYQRAMQQSPNNNIASFNLGNALFRANKPEEAIEQFEASAGVVKNKVAKADALYNKGVVLTKQKKLDESIGAYKNALRVNPLDSLARENLQRALNEKKQQDEQQNKKDKQQNKQQNKLNKQQVMQMLNALQEQEKQLQQKMQKSKVPSPGQPEKDWTP